MARILPWILLPAALASAAGDVPVMPSWMVPYPGATERTRSMTGRAWSNYLAKAPADDVIEYYRGLFEQAGLTFHPVKDGLGTTIRGAPPECSLDIVIQAMGRNTSVAVTCSAWASGHMEGQAKYDNPVYPKPRAPLPPLVWPDWLTTCDPAAASPGPEIQKGVDRFKVRYLKAEFTTQMDREAIMNFYADLLNAHDYPVWIRSSSVQPRDHTMVVEGQHFFGDKPGPRFAIHVQLTPAGDAVQVELRISAHPY